MSGLLTALLLGGYSFVVLPAIVLIAATFFDRSQSPEQPSRHKLLAFMTLTGLILALLGLLIWFNPYGREISSSLPGFGVLIVLVALLVYLLRFSRSLAGLWATDKALLSIYVLIYMALFGFLWLGDRFAFIASIVLPLALALIWSLPRSGLFVLVVLSLLTLAALIFITGGWIYLPSPDLPTWTRTVFAGITVISMLLSLLLPASLLYASLGVPATDKKLSLLWSLILSMALFVGAAYQVAWDGIWSSAHARAFEDHLPFAHFMLSLVAGVLLALTLRGWRRLVGPSYVLVVTVATVSALAWGWNLSAFEMTERRAASVESAIMMYYQEHGAYPANLGELSPRYLLFLSPPLVVRTGGWCYQSTGGAFRLGYVSGNFTYFTQEFKVETYAQKGTQSTVSWACDELRDRLQAKELRY